MFGIYYRLLGIQKLNSSAKRYIGKSILVAVLYFIIFSFTSTFFVLYALDILNQDFALFSTILAAQYLIQATTDYPTGTVGDWIGQRWILGLSTIFYGLGFISLSFATDYLSLLVAFVLLALAQGQQSGAFQAWFDNNYKLYAPEDSKKSVYVEIMGKFGMLTQIGIALAFIIGGIVVFSLGRSTVFFIQGILVLLYTGVIVVFITDHPELTRDKPNLASYFSLLTEGISSTAKNRTLRLVILGTVVGAAGMTVWGNMILFPLYESYGKTDDLTAFLRSSIFIAGAILLGVVSGIARKLEHKQKWLAWSTFVVDGIFFLGFYVMLLVSPPDATFNVVKYLLVFVTFVLVSVPRSLQNALMPRFFLDIIPDKNRNAVYSLIPTLVLLINIVSVPIGGYLLTNLLSVQEMLLILATLGLLGGAIIAYAIFTHQPQKLIPHKTELLKLLDMEGTRFSIPLSIQRSIQTVVPPPNIPTTWRVSNYIQNFYDTLLFVALDNEVLVDTEKQLLQLIMKHTQHLATVLEQALASGYITAVDQKAIFLARDQIWEEAFYYAFTDQTLDQRENAILLKLAQLLRDLTIAIQPLEKDSEFP